MVSKMSEAEIQAVRNDPKQLEIRSRRANFGPERGHFDDFARSTVSRSLPSFVALVARSCRTCWHGGDRSVTSTGRSLPTDGRWLPRSRCRRSLQSYEKGWFAPNPQTDDRLH